ncbi:MAG: hypothetical protein KBA26_01255 [Candidatus Delongbacteria bacterium]|nr:hypothetical protein [Candidatus Delongbacteria bacterium]
MTRYPLRYSLIMFLCLTGLYCEKAKTSTQQDDIDTDRITIELTANPDTLKIGTIKASTIWAKVTEDQALAADSTLVSFSSSLGSITESSITLQGRATATLQNSDTTTTGLCRVIGIVKNVEDTIYILFKK